MKLRRAPLEVNPQKPFERDVLDRQESAEILTSLVESVSDAFVMSIDAPWGYGKTSFVRMWAQHLKNAGFVSITFNAWETDFVADPLVALVGELSKGIEGVGFKGAEKTKLRKAYTRVKNGAASVAKRAIPVVAKLATAGILDIEEVAKEAAKDIGSAVEKYAKDAIDSYEKDKESLAHFKKMLEEFTSKLLAGAGRTPLVLIVDELDRCRPSYAVQVLERIKHLFSVSNIVFVLSLDTEQLAHAVRSIYGPTFDADGYLRRFFDLHYRLPAPIGGKYSEYLLKERGLDGALRAVTEGQYASGHFLETFKAASASLGLSLRDEEQCVGRLEVVIRSSKPDGLSNAQVFLLGVLLPLRLKDEKKYRDFLTGAIHHSEILKLLEENPASRKFFNEENYGIAARTFVRGALMDSTAINNEIASINGRLPSAAVPERDRLGTEMNAFTEIARRHRDGRDFIKRLARKIEVSDRFMVAREGNDTLRAVGTITSRGS